MKKEIRKSEYRENSKGALVRLFISARGSDKETQLTDVADVDMFGFESRIRFRLWTVMIWRVLLS